MSAVLIISSPGRDDLINVDPLVEFKLALFRTKAIRHPLTMKIALDGDPLHIYPCR
jgi:hypothetical protein